MNDVERLKRTLLENGESAEEAESLAQLAHQLRQVSAPQARTMAQQALLAALERDLPPPQTAWQRLRDSYAFLLLQSQFRLIHLEIWLASALVMALGVLVTLGAPANTTLPFVMIAPVVAALGVAFLYDGNIEAMLELEASTRTSPRLLLLARLCLVFGFDLMLALIGSIILALLNSHWTLIALIAEWLAPMSFLSALAFFLSISLVEPMAASAFSLMLWVMHILFKNSAHLHDLFLLLSLPGFTESRPSLMVVALLLVVVALWMVGIKERHFTQGDWS